MDPVAAPQTNINQNPGLVNQPPLPTKTGMTKGKFFLYIFFALLVIALLVFGFFIGVNMLNKSSSKAGDFKDTTGSSLNTDPVYEKFQSTLKFGGELITASGFQVAYKGTLTGVDSGKSWVLQGSQTTVTINHEGQGVVRYFRTTESNPLPQFIDESEVKVGDFVSIQTSIDPKTGIVSVNSIGVGASAQTQESTPSAS